MLPKYAAMIASAERLMEIEAIQGIRAVPEEDSDSLYAGIRELRAEGLRFSYDRESILDGLILRFRRVRLP